jgi:FAD/FMN-containing dehydrogenase
MLTRRSLLAAGAVMLAARELPAEAATRIPAARLRELQAKLKGRVLAPGQSGFVSAARVFNTRFDGIRPPAVVKVKTPGDVREVVRWANRHDIALVGRSGGNGYTGNSTSRDAVVVDMGALNGIALHGSTVTLGPGARLIDVYTRLAAHGATIPAGSCPMVAAGGHVLGGGMGLAGRDLGLALDRVRSLQAVTAAGELITVDAHHQPDLFWALRGGGGSFALVTELQLKVHAVTSGAWFAIDYPRTSRSTALAVWDAFAPHAPRALTSIFALTSAGAQAFGQYLGSEAKLRALLGTLKVPSGASLRTGTLSYLGLMRRWAGCADPGCHPTARATFDASSVYVAKQLSSAGIDAFVAAADTGATLLCDAYGGAINEVASDATAFVHRNARFSVQILSYTSVGVAKARVRAARKLVAPFGDGHAYQNYPDLDIADAPQAYYGGNLSRLRQIKRHYDPHHRFQVTQGVS